MKDNKGREYAKLSMLKAGDTVDVDDGFRCMKDQKVVREHNGELFVQCSHGRHYLSGQLDDQDGDSLVGIYPVQS